MGLLGRDCACTRNIPGLIGAGSDPCAGEVAFPVDQVMCLRIARRWVSVTCWAADQVLPASFSFSSLSEQGKLITGYWPTVRFPEGKILVQIALSFLKTKQNNHRKKHTNNRKKKKKHWNKNIYWIGTKTNDVACAS